MITKLYFLAPTLASLIEQVLESRLKKEGIQNTSVVSTTTEYALMVNVFHTSYDRTEHPMQVTRIGWDIILDTNKLNRALDSIVQVAKHINTGE